MKISFCLIIKDDSELPSLKKLMPTVSPYVDSVHITANGKEVGKIEEYVSSNGWNYTYKKWTKNFAEARNFNFSQVDDDTDFILWLDTDDQLIRGDKLRDIAKTAMEKGNDAVFFTYWYGAKFSGEPSMETFEKVELSQMRERLIKPGTIEWKSRLHETPVPKDGAKYTYSVCKYHEKDQPLVVLHLGADRDIHEEDLLRRMKRNQELLELQLADERAVGEADPRTLLYLMKIYAESEDQEVLSLCIDMGTEYLAKSGWDQERARANALMAVCYGKLGHYRQAEVLLMDAIREFEADPLLYLHLSRVYSRLGKWRQMKHWLKIGLEMDLTEHSSSMDNILELEILSTELMLDLYTNGEKKVHKALVAAKKLLKLNPTEQNETNVELLTNLTKLDKASERAHKLVIYMNDIGKPELIEPFLNTLPKEIGSLPFAYKLRNKFATPRVWRSDEICYLANFGGDHFEKWSPESLASGIGGSETAVIQLSKKWVEMGYKVTVYGDPPRGKEGDYDGVTYLPWYAFNRKDKFNIFIQWRNGSLAKKVSAKKFYIDLHDVAHSIDYADKLDQIDKIFVKSEYHRNLLKDIPSSKIQVISNGISV